MCTLMGVEEHCVISLCSDFSGISCFGIRSILPMEDLTEKYPPFSKKCVTKGYKVVIFMKEVNR